MKYLLFRVVGKGGYVLPENYRLVVFSPSLFKLIKKKCTFTEWLWNIASFWKNKVYLVLDSDGNIAHRSYLVSRNFKFPFLKNREKELGPCFTNKDYRGKGIYPAVIEKASEDKMVYMLVREDNLSSIRGIQKAGASQIAYVKKNRFGQWIKYD